MEHRLQNLWVGVDITESSRELLEALTNNIKTYTQIMGIDFKHPSRHHMTLGYFKDITDQELINLLHRLDDLKKTKNNLILVNPNEPYDETLHKITGRKSNVDDRFYFVLIPHNPDNIYKKMIQDHSISPHISLGSITHNTYHINTLMPGIKYFRNIHLHNSSIVVDLSKILIKFDY